MLEPGCTVIGPTVIGSGCVVQSGACVEESILFPHTRVGGAAHLRRTVVCDGHCANVDGTVIDLERARLEWLIGDARSPRTPLDPQQRELAAVARHASDNGRSGGTQPREP